MQVLKSYVKGQWVAGSGAPASLVNPATEEVLAETSTEGVDMAGALAFARDEGGRAMRALSFEERGELLSKTSLLLHQHRNPLLDLAVANGGNTRGDAKFDVDGAIGTLAYYAGIGKKLGAQKVFVDGAAEQLGRSPRYVTEHLLLPRRGVAVHVNAFNFPAWGFGEKAACALLAGMPVVVKPATSTALLAHRIFELIVEAGIFPAGALSLIAGAPRDLLHHLEGEDVLSFTGGSSTARTLRALPAIVERSIRLNVEADSLNAAVLGRDVEPGSDTYNAFLRDVVRDLTQKTGQKCTAIRRIFVAEQHRDRVVDDLADRLREVVVGNPAEDKVTMGPVSTATQKRDVLAGIELLASESKRVVGDGVPSTVGAPEGKGYFVPPTLFVANDAKTAKQVHDHEVFGPCATVLAYDSDETAVTAVRRGGGSLVTSLYSDDRAVMRGLGLEIASANGRVVLASAKVVESMVGPGAVLPQSIHGGPGRAGGGEELGGTRGLGFYSQRVAIQGDRPHLDHLLDKAKPTAG